MFTFIMGSGRVPEEKLLRHLKKVDCFDLLQDFGRTREVGEFLSGALAGAMTKAILAPLETIRLVSLLLILHNLRKLVD